MEVLTVCATLADLLESHSGRIISNCGTAHSPASNPANLAKTKNFPGFRSQAELLLIRGV